MEFEVQGFKCKKHFHKTHLKRKVFHRLEDPNVLTAERNYLPLPKLEKVLNKLKESIVFSSELPNVPFYMPKLISKTHSPLKSMTKSRFERTRVNVFTPQQSRRTTRAKNRRDLVSRMLGDSIITERLIGKNRELVNPGMT